VQRTSIMERYIIHDFIKAWNYETQLSDRSKDEKDMNNQESKRATPWFLIIVFFLLVTGILATGFFFYHAQQRRIKTEAQNNIAAIADLKVSQIARWRQERMIDAKLTYENAAFIRLVSEYLRVPRKSGAQQEIFKLMKSFQKDAGYKSVLLLDIKGHVRLSISQDKDTVGSYGQSIFHEVLLHRQVILSDLHQSAAIPFVHLDLIIPLVSPDRRDSSMIGALFLRIDPNDVLFPLIQAWPTPSRTSETLLLEQDGDSIVYLNELRHRKNTTLSLRLPISNRQLIASKAVRGIQGTAEGTDYRGVPVLAEIRKIQNTAWFMIAKVDQEEIFAPLQFQAWIVGLGVFLSILSTAAIIGFWWRHQRARFYREQYEAQLGRQALVKHFEYLVKHAHDIILLIDMDGRISEANDQACRTYGYTQEEMHRINIQDIRMPGAPSEIEIQMKQQEELEGLLFETEHRRKDGSTFPVEISSQFIKIDNAKYMQCIIRDITDRKRAEEILRESEAKLQEAQHIAGIGHYIFDIAAGLWTCSKMLDEIFGIEKNFNKTFDGWKDIIHPDDRDEMSRYLSEYVIHGKNPFDKEYRIIRRSDGAVRWLHGLGNLEFDVNGQPLKMFGIIQDITEKKQAEDTLRESEDRFRRIFEEGPLGMATSGSDFKFMKVNAAFCRMMGYEENELTSLTFKDITDPEYITDDIASIKNLFAGVLPVYHTEKRYIRKDKRVVWGAATISVVRDKNNRFLYFIAMIENISERKHAEAALLESEGLFKTLVESSPVSIAVFSGPNQRIKYVSHRFTELFGYEQTDLPTLSAWWPLAYPMEEYRNQIEAAWHSSLEWSKRENQESEPVESVITCKDGSSKYIESLFTSMGDLTLVFFSDLTQRRMAEEALRQTHAFNDLLIQTMPFGMNIVDEEGNILFVSKTMKEMLPVDVVDMCCWKVYKDDNQQCQNCPLKSGISFGRPEVIETTGVLGGKTFQISHVGMMYEGRKAMLEVFQDITEQKKLQLELMQSQKMLSIGTLAGGIAHDFNNILAIILGYINILHSMKDNPQKFSDGVSAIKQAVDRGAGLVKQILTFASKTSVDFEPTKVPEVARELVSMLQQTFPKTITFNQEIETDLPVINADHTQIHQVLLNLCVNARDAMPQGGVITIKAYQTAGDTLVERFPAATEQRYIGISVSDTGTGMDETTRERIFDPFFTTKEKGKGTGLGLSVVYGVVQAHHGFIEVESTVASGTTFRLYLPVQKETIAVIEARNATGQVHGGTETLLVVEDEDLLRDMVQILLEANGYSVLTAKDGMEAVEMYSQRKQEIALVISDMGLPKLSGDSEFKKLKEINPEVKMILASGYFDPGIKAKLESTGVLGFLQKPYIIEEVLTKIRKALD
jgi:two-component system, cell cycle sensor histidine kinase and response regulator CckA